MNITFATRAIGATRLALKANAPTLMVAGGVASMGAAVITASRKTLKVDEVVADHVRTLENIDNSVGQRTLTGDEYTALDARNDRFKVYPRIGAVLCKHYAVPGVLFFGGAALVFGGHRIMLKRNATLALAFTTLQKAYERYRANAVAAMGPEFDRAMLKGYKNVEVVDPETGKTETISKMDWDGDDFDPYNRVFNQATSSLWRPDIGINRDLLEVQQQYAQQRLNARGYLYLSEVYESLGIDESSISRVVGWKVKRNPDGTKDIPMVDFGLNKVHEQDWAYTRDHEVYLDFNCQGYIVGGTVQKLLEQA